MSPPDVGERVRLMRDGLVNCSEYLVSGLIGILIVPLMLRGLGAEAYGLWLAAMAVGAMAEMLDCNLDFSVTREVAAAGSGTGREETERFVGAAGNAYLLFGAAGAVLIAALGLSLSGGLHLSAENRKLAPVLFGCAGIGFFANQLTQFAMAVLAGLRRFDTINQVGIVAALLRAAGIVGLLAAGAGLASVAAWQAAVSLAAAHASLVMVARIEPRYRSRLGAFRWDIIRPHVSSGLAVAFALAIYTIYWQMPQLLLGVVGGATWIAQYHIAQRFPLTALSITGRLEDVLFPAVSQHDRGGDMPRLREVLDVGTRWIVVLSLPLCLVLGIIAPDLLRAWLGEAPPETVTVLRLTAATVFLNALAGASQEVLWGRGITRPVVAVFLGFTVLSLVLVLLLLSRNGIVGAAWGMFLTMACGSFALLHLASRACECRLITLIRATFGGLLVPALVSAAMTLGAAHLAGPSGWPGVIGAALAGGAAYAAGLYLLGGRAEERVFAKQCVSLPALLWSRMPL